MADEAETTVEVAAEPELTVEVVPDDNKPGKPQLTDEEVSKMAEMPAEDEIGRYAKDAQRRIKNLHLVSQEWRRRVVQSSKDVATATSLAEQLYRENQQLRQATSRSEAALIEQALARAESQLAQAKGRAKAAFQAGDADAIVSANEEVARFVAEADRLRLLKPAEGAASPGDQQQPQQVQPQQPQQPRPPNERVQAWTAKNNWFGKAGEEEMTGFAMGIHQNLERQGITEENNPELYWSTIDRRLREVYPNRFKEPAASTAAAATEAAAGSTAKRPVAVTGATRVNGGAAAGRRHVTLSESQVRIAKQLGLTPEQYATQLVKEAKEGGGTIQ